MRAPTLVYLLLPLALLASTTPAAATDVYAERVAQKLQAPCTPSCTLCHVSAKGGPGMINPKFGAAAKLAGLQGAGQVALLDTTLDKMAMAGTDADLDGKVDIVEIQEGDDPNGAGLELCVGPKYGCGAATIARTPRRNAADPAAAVAAMLTLLAGALFLRRRC